MLSQLKVWWFTRKLRSPDPRARVAGILGLGKVGDPRTGPSLLRMVTDEDALVRSHAVKTLCELHPPGCVEALLPLLSHQDAEVRRTVEDALAALDPQWPTSPAARRAVGRLALEIQATDQGGEGVAAALTRLVPPSRILHLLTYFPAEEGPISPPATALLDRLDPDWRETKRLLPPFRRLSHEMPLVVSEAAAELGRSRHPGAVVPLAEALANPNRGVRFAVIRALLGMGPVAVEPLQRMLGEEVNPELRAWMGRVLEEVGRQEQGPDSADLQDLVPTDDTLVNDIVDSYQRG